MGISTPRQSPHKQKALKSIVTQALRTNVRARQRATKTASRVKMVKSLISSRYDGLPRLPKLATVSHLSPRKSADKISLGHSKQLIWDSFDIRKYFKIAASLLSSEKEKREYNLTHRNRAPVKMICLASIESLYLPAYEITSYSDHRTDPDPYKLRTYRYRPRNLPIVSSGSSQNSWLEELCVRVRVPTFLRPSYTSSSLVNGSLGTLTKSVIDFCRISCTISRSRKLKFSTAHSHLQPFYYVKFRPYNRWRVCIPFHCSAIRFISNFSLVSTEFSYH